MYQPVEYVAGKKVKVKSKSFHHTAPPELLSSAKRLSSTTITPAMTTLLEHIAATDDLKGTPLSSILGSPLTICVSSDWNELRQTIKQKLEENVKEYGTSTAPPAPPPFNGTASTQGGLKLPPFPPKKLSQLHMYDPPLSYMNEEQVKDALQAVFDQLDSFDECVLLLGFEVVLIACRGPPFTIQRLCELLLDPKKHYNSVGKYLRAVEKSILVTSTHNSFPIEPTPSSDLPSNPNGNGHTTIAFVTRSTPSTPLFSPIAFLHEDARISRSRSHSLSPTRAEREGTHPPGSPTPEPMTPLLLNADLPAKAANENAVKREEEGPVGLGMVDELDDPKPGHTSETPKPLTIAAGAKPFLGSLEDRFVKAETAEEGKQEESAAKKPKLEASEETKMDQDPESKAS
ncbi:hypothetical protein NMY22_g11487 [Coprinellus aureogranulatus]|nr:hypothetical protein NMY22_g11487 [Coprinellus aureogranulatus]